VRLLDEVARALTQVRDVESVLRAIERPVLQGFADLVVLIRREGPEARLEVIERDPLRNEPTAELLRSLLPNITRAVERDLRQGRAFRWIPKVSPNSLSFLRAEPALYEAVRALKVHSLMIVPLLSGGGIAFARITPGKPFHAADLAAAQVIGRRMSATLQTAESRGRDFDEEIRRSRLESALQKWIQVFDDAGWGAAIVDGHDHHIEVVNPAFARLHGYSGPENLSGRSFTDLLPRERSDEPSLWNGAAQGASYESLHVRANGAAFPVLTNVTPLVTADGTTSYVVTIQDLTELKRTEERLRRAQRLESVGRLAGGVAHEVNNMMTIILGFSDLLARSGGIAPGRERDIEEIRKAAARAGKITQQLLAFSRQQILQPTDISINEVVRELVPVLRLLLPANIELETNLAPLDPGVHADRAQLDQVIINLVFNARDAMPEGGLLKLTIDSRRLDESDGRRLIGISIPAGQYALVSVIDTGHGMDAATLTQVFEPFFTTKAVGAGTGLGLATVYGIVKQSGGYVWVESSPGVGTTVTVCLPQVREAAQLPAGTMPGRPPAECRTGTVLVVEDESGVRELTHRVLEQQGHRIIEATDGNEALSRLAEFGPELDLVLCDVIVPNIGTGEFEQRVRELRPELPLLYMSGYSRQDVVERGLIHPDRPFLQKPFTAAELTELVSRELEASPGTRGGQVTT
jgi:PAS domain S-box-containing protein